MSSKILNSGIVSYSPLFYMLFGHGWAAGLLGLFIFLGKEGDGSLLIESYRIDYGIRNWERRIGRNRNLEIIDFRLGFNE
jgi:hypothetical protein